MPSAERVIQMVAQLAVMGPAERAAFYANAVLQGASYDVLKVLHDHCAPKPPAGATSTGERTDG